MRGLATKLKSKLKNPEIVCVYKTPGMKITHLTTRLPGYVNKDTEAVIIHLGTNDIGGQANKAIQDINELTQKMKTLQNTSGGIGILVANKFEKHTKIDSTYDHLVWLTVTTEYYQKNIKIGCAYIPPEKLHLCWSKK